MQRSHFLLWRITLALVTVLVAVTANFALFRLAPGDPTARFARNPNVPTEAREMLRTQFGLDQPVPVQYVAYLRELGQGNLGLSFANGQPVADNLRTAVANTVPMVAVGLLAGITLGVVTGVVAAWRRGGAVDTGSVMGALVFYSLPAQWLGLMLILVFSGTLPSGGRGDPFLVDPGIAEGLVDTARHMVLPSATLALGLFGAFTLVARSSMLETLGEDYVLSARAKGFSNRHIVRYHALRNAMLPTVSLIGLQLGFVVAGALLVETVFSWPGIGRALYQSVLARDYPMLQGAFLLITVSVVVCNFLADAVLYRLDPRIR